jgi:hypothetical protein
MWTHRWRQVSFLFDKVKESFSVTRPNANEILSIRPAITRKALPFKPPDMAGIFSVCIQTKYGWEMTMQMAANSEQWTVAREGANKS